MVTGVLSLTTTKRHQERERSFTRPHRERVVTRERMTESSELQLQTHRESEKRQVRDDDRAKYLDVSTESVYCVRVLTSVSVI